MLSVFHTCGDSNSGPLPHDTSALPNELKGIPPAPEWTTELDIIPVVYIYYTHTNECFNDFDFAATAKQRAKFLFIRPSLCQFATGQHFDLIAFFLS